MQQTQDGYQIVEDVKNITGSEGTREMWAVKLPKPKTKTSINQAIFW